MTMEQEMQNTDAAIREQMVADGYLMDPNLMDPKNVAADFREKMVGYVPQVSHDFCVQLTSEEVVLVRKVLQVANTLFTVADKEYHENKIDALLRKLREKEAENDK